jgi:hypothetical protein
MAKAKASSADALLERVRAICMGFPATQEKLSHGSPVFHVRGKLFVMFMDQHHDDGRVAVWCKATHQEQRAMVQDDPDRFFVPPYVGVKGWVGVRLDKPAPDWVGLSIVAEHGWTSVAPPKVRSGQWVPDAPPPPPPVRKTTDPKVAREALARVTKVCLALPDTTCEREAQHATFRAKKKVFAYFLDNHHGDGVVSVCVKMPKQEAAAISKKEPKRFYLPAYIGGMGYVGVRLDGSRIDWKDVEARIAASYEAATSKRPKPSARTARSRHSPR